MPALFFSSSWFTTMWKSSCCLCIFSHELTILLYTKNRMYFRANINITWNRSHFQILPVLYPILSQAAGRHESLTGQNMEKKAKWKDDLQKDGDSTIVLSEKAQWLRKTNPYSTMSFSSNIGPIVFLFLLYLSQRSPLPSFGEVDQQISEQLIVNSAFATRRLTLTHNNG